MPITNTSMDGRIVLLKVELLQTEATARRLWQEIEFLRYQQNEHAMTFRFLDLPREMRNMVYELCVAPGKVFVRPRSQDDARCKDMLDYSKPEWQLLTLNHQIRDEAGEVYFKKNQIIFNYELDYEFIVGQYCQHPTVALGTLSTKHLSSVSLAFDMRSGAMYSGDALMNAAGLRPDYNGAHPTQWSALTPQERVKLAHGRICCNTICWAEILDGISGQVFPSPSLRFLQIDVTNCYCSLGCCRLIEQAAETLASSKFGKKLERIEILGTKNRAERDEFIEQLLDPAYEDLRDRQPILQFRTFKLEIWEGSDLKLLHQDDLDHDLGDEEVDLRPLWEDVLGLTAEDE